MMLRRGEVLLSGSNEAVVMCTAPITTCAHFVCTSFAAHCSRCPGPLVSLERIAQFIITHTPEDTSQSQHSVVYNSSSSSKIEVGCDIRTEPNSGTNNTHANANADANPNGIGASGASEEELKLALR
jgi:hypothetical protein